MTTAELKAKSKDATNRLRLVTISSVNRAKRRQFTEKETEEFVRNNIERFVV